MHNTHHPIASALYYEDQRKEAKRYTREFWKRRPQKYLGYFERVLDESGGPWLNGRRLSYADLSLFQIVEGLRYAFPKAMRRLEREDPARVAVHDAVAERPRIAAYLASPRRIPSTSTAFSGTIGNSTLSGRLARAVSRHGTCALAAVLEEQLHVFRAVVVGDLLAGQDAPDRLQEDLAADQHGLRVRPAGMVGVAPDIVAAAAVDASSGGDLEDVFAAARALARMRLARSGCAGRNIPRSTRAS